MTFYVNTNTVWAAAARRRYWVEHEAGGAIACRAARPPPVPRGGVHYASPGKSRKFWYGPESSFGRGIAAI